MTLSQRIKNWRVVARCYVQGRESTSKYFKFNNWVMVSVRPAIYRCKREVSKHKRNLRVARGDSRVRLSHESHEAISEYDSSFWSP